MIGLIALAILGFWIFIVFKITAAVSKEIESKKVKKIVLPLVFMLVFCAPVGDEIIAGFQFRSLCSKDSVAFVNEEKARGKTLQDVFIVTHLTGYIVPIKKVNFSYNDIDTGETVVSWSRYSATGGWLARAVDLGTSHPPFTFSDSCRPEYSGMDIVKKLNINLLPQIH